MIPRQRAPPPCSGAQVDAAWIGCGGGGACLQLAEQRHGVPSIEGAHRAEISERDAEGRRQVAIEVDVVNVDQQADNASHRDAAVLDLSVAEEGERLVTTHRGETIRVEDLAASLRAGAHPGGAVHKTRAQSAGAAKGFRYASECTPPGSASPKPNNAVKCTHIDSTPICAVSCCSLGACTPAPGAKPETPPTIIIMSETVRVGMSAGQTTA